MLPATGYILGLILLAAAGAGIALQHHLRGRRLAPSPASRTALCMGATVLAFDRGLILAGLQAKIRRLPAWLYCWPRNSPMS